MTEGLVLGGGPWELSPQVCVGDSCSRDVRDLWFHKTTGEGGLVRNQPPRKCFTVDSSLSFGLLLHPPGRGGACVWVRSTVPVCTGQCPKLCTLGTLFLLCGCRMFGRRLGLRSRILSPTPVPDCGTSRSGRLEPRLLPLLKKFLGNDS